MNKAPGGQYQWMDNSRLDYTNWKFGQPDMQPGEMCVMSEYEPVC
jgi:hypothetical protein